MAELRRADDGTWTLIVSNTQLGDRNTVYDEALPRYLTAFDPAFSAAESTCECEFVKALLRVRSLQDAGWDPYESTLRAIPAMVELHERIPQNGWHDFQTARHLQLWTYGHIIEASEPYAIVADMLDIATGGFFKPFRFPPIAVRRTRSNDPFPATRPQFFREKLPELERLATAAGMPGVLDPIREVWDYELRNAIFHADYSLHGGEVRIPARAYTHDEIQELVNRALAYHEALALLVSGHRRAYEEPKRLAVHPELAREPDEAMTVMVRDGEGAIGLRYVYTPEQVAAGAISAHLARLFPDEIALVDADPTLVRLPVRRDDHG